MKKRIVSLTMVLALCLMLLPTSAFAAEDSGAAIGTGGLCVHHMEHDDTCGYVEGIAESPCTHEHSEDCYTKVTSCTHEHTGECYPASDSSIPEDGTTSSEDESVADTMPSDDESGKDTTLPEAAEPSLCSHVCSEESGCIKQELDCKHEHNEECGYAPAVEGQPCTYVCTQCGMTEITAWSWVDAQDAIDLEKGGYLPCPPVRIVLFPMRISLICSRQKSKPLQRTAQKPFPWIAGAVTIIRKREPIPAAMLFMQYCPRAMGWQRMHLPSP